MRLTLLLSLSAPILLGFFPFPGPGRPPAGAPPSSPITASATASQTSCTAPCYVFFDGTGTTHTDGDVRPSQDLDFVWDFDDTNAGTWATDGASRNVGRGHINAHVYESAGTHDWVLTVTDEAGNTDTETGQVVVTATASAYTDAQTWCFENTTDSFDGCPLDTDNDGTCENEPTHCVDTSDFDAALGSSGCNVHNSAGPALCLFASDDSFAASSLIDLRQGPVHIGSFTGSGDTGAHPAVDASSLGSSTALFNLGDPSITSDDITITAIDFTGSGIAGANGNDLLGMSSNQGGASNVLVLNVDATGFAQTVGYVTGGPGSYPDPIPDLLALVDVTHSDPGRRTIGYFRATRIAIMGSEFDQDSGAASGFSRFQPAKGVVIVHNTLTGTATGNQAFKIAGYQWDSDVTGETQIDSATDGANWLIADNSIDCVDTGCIGGYNFDGPLGNGVVFSNAIIERNEFKINGFDFIIENCFTQSSFRNNVAINANSIESGALFTATEGDCSTTNRIADTTPLSGTFDPGGGARSDLTFSNGAAGTWRQGSTELRFFLDSGSNPTSGMTVTDVDGDTATLTSDAVTWGYTRDDVRIYNNTFYSPAPTSTPGVGLDSELVNPIIRNNILYSPNDTSTNRIVTGSGTGVTQSNNTQSDADEFNNTGAFDEATDFVLNSGFSTTEYPAGLDLFATDEDGEANFREFDGTLRPAGNTDPGAWIAP